MKTVGIKGIFIPLAITLLCFIFISQNNAFAQDKPAKNVRTVRVERAKVINQGNANLKLTDDQKAKMKDLRFEQEKAMQSLKAQSQEMAAHLRTLKLADKPDNKAIFKTIDEMVAVHGDIMKRQITFEQSMKAILTPEQLKEFQIRQMNRRAHMGGRNQFWGQAGNRNFGRMQMMGRNGMNRPGMMGAQMGQGGMRPQGQMMNRPNFGGNQMMPQVQMQKRIQMMRQHQMKADSTKAKQ
ncbi:MAG: Spy/CpxP family protein refolding chaperone [Bacteroidota bacterium]|nr:Spy/CpxP family protein refolding chaperone [Bacteroidota bacterium]